MCSVVYAEILQGPQNKGETIHEKGESVTRHLKERIQDNRSLANLIHGIHMTANTAMQAI